MSSKTSFHLAKGTLNVLAAILVVPGLVSFAIRARLLGRDRALQGSSQIWALVPGLPGQYLRRAFYRRALRGFGDGAVVEFGALLSKADCVIGDHVYIGPHCHLGLVSIGEGALIAAGVHCPSGSQTHGIERLDVPLREQEGEIRRIEIGADAWIGSNAVVMADVGQRSIVAAGAVVVDPVPPQTIVGGVPARVLRSRDEEPGHSETIAGRTTGERAG